MFEPLLSPLFSSLFSSLIAAAQRIFIKLNGVDEYFTFQNTKTFPNDFDLSIDAVLPTAATTVTLFGQTASADHYIKALSTGFVSINIDTSIVTSTVLATKDSKQRRYGVRVVGDDFIFTENGATIDTVTDAVAAAKSLIINVIAQSNGADFFNKTLSDPILTDLTTASNSVSWQLNRALPATTEQSADGTNLLTYVGAPKTQLFTLNQSVTPNRWDGSVDLITQSVWESPSLAQNQWSFSNNQWVLTGDGSINSLRLLATAEQPDMMLLSGNLAALAGVGIATTSGGVAAENTLNSVGAYSIILEKSEITEQIFRRETGAVSATLDKPKLIEIIEIA